MTCYENWSIFTNLLIAIGTILAVIVAIFGDSIKKCIFRAELNVEILDKKGDFITLNNGLNAYYYHLKIKNNRQSIKIDKCKVFLKKIQKSNFNNEYVDLPLAVPQRFLWAPKEISPAEIDIYNEQILDFGILTQNSVSKSYQFNLVLNSTPNNFKGFISPNESFRYFLEILADNYRSKKLIIVQVSWNGKWVHNSDKMDENLKIEFI